jgi:hypothetical protein
MVQANELRIGNWVNPEEPYQIWEIERDTIYADPPIPLTPELLKKCGFEKSGEFLTLVIPVGSEKHYFSTILSGTGVKIFTEFEPSEPISTEVTYLHQLQNLYFALTGSELSINL